MIGEALSIASEVGGGDESDEGGSLTSLLAALEDAATSGDEVPESFQEEAFSLEGFTELRCDLDSGVIGFTAQGEAEEVFEEIEAALEEGGWTFVESGLEACGTFAKTSGDYQWLFVSCAQVGDSTSVVMQVDSFKEGE